ncbi:MAG: hypothetical protein QM775_11950 [Pirellulales bacterium]
MAGSNWRTVATVLLALSAIRTGAAAEPLNLYEAIEDGAVEAKVIARDAYHLRVFLKNPGKNPVSVELPPVLAARPVLAQGFFNPGGGQQGSGTSMFGQGSQSGGQTQAISGPSPFMGGGSSGMGLSAAGGGLQGGAVFAIPPESVREFRVGTVCVEHGKPNPRNSVKYELVRPEEAGVGPELQDVLVQSRGGKLDRDVVQAAAWHLANDKTWDELRQMSTWVALNAKAPLFSSQELMAAQQLVTGAERRVAERAKKSERPLAASRGKPVEQNAAGRWLPTSAKKL